MANWSNIIRFGVLLSGVAGLGCDADWLPRESPSGEAAAAQDEQAAARNHSDALPPQKVDGARGSDWPTFLGPTGDGKSSEKGIIRNWERDGLSIVWQKELGTSYGIGSVANGRYYQFDRFRDQARLTCMDAASGLERWRFEYPTDYADAYQYNGGPRCSPVVHQGMVYLYGVEGMLYCVEAETGKEVWHVDTVAKFGVVQNFFGVGSTPVVAGDLLLVMVGGSPPESRGLSTSQLEQVVGNGSGIVAFDRLTGKIKYQITGELASYSSLKLSHIEGRDWCFAFARGGLVGFDPSRGAVDFHYPWRASVLESVNASTPVVVGNEVFISETYGPGSSLLRVSPGKHEVIWSDDPRSRRKAMQTHWNTPIQHQGFLYGCSGRHTGNAELRCVAWKTGKVMWSVPGLSRTSLLYVDGLFVCLGEYGELTLFKANPKKFEPVARLMIDEAGKPTSDPEKSVLKYPCWAAPILSHGLMYVRGNRRLLCLRLIEAPQDTQDAVP